MSAQTNRSAWVVLREQMLELWKRTLRISRRNPKGLRLCESLPLGEHRFVAVVEFEKTRFLLGGTTSSLVLLSRLPDAGERADDQSKTSTVWTAGERRLQGWRGGK